MLPLLLALMYVRTRLEVLRRVPSVLLLFLLLGAFWMIMADISALMRGDRYICEFETLKYFV
ncbi:hypothetical protein BCR39DRAFT_518606 [Naematelia encephala]|uniref:Uncharacterized protein n=1 Tax=Naematelia encephala TaxID=71784 RepID=A0A1Y2BFV4_9TREE|nr:hypothetical protein BCR39DRAFT_518606 [Naematelia encephala]